MQKCNYLKINLQNCTYIMILRNNKCINEDIQVCENKIKLLNPITIKNNKKTRNICTNICTNLSTNNRISNIILNKKNKCKYVLIQKKPMIKYYFLSQKEKNDKIKAFNTILSNFKYN